MKRIFSYTLFLSLLCACAHVDESVTTTCNVLPIPRSVGFNGDCFTFDGNVSLNIIAGEEDKRVLKEFLATSPLAFSEDGGGWSDYRSQAGGTPPSRLLHPFRG